jgi:transcriptional accessory protein Tex/SPT6
LDTPPLVAITTGIGGLAEVASVDGTGAITSINITDDGAFYSVEPAINISTVTGADADLEAVLTNGEISSVTIGNGGANYQVGDV